MRRVVVTGMGAVTAFGNSIQETASGIRDGGSAIGPANDHRDLLPVPGFAVATLDVRPLLKRRKDRKLLPRAAELALWAAAEAMGDESSEGAGLFLGVGREPPDDGETERALVAAMRDGTLDPQLLDGPGRALYPPLASLRTLPNLQLAHLAIQLGFTGPGGTRAGAQAAGLAALVEGYFTVAEGRADIALAGGADSLVNSGSARDLVRAGEAGPHRAPGEGAALFRLECADRVARRGGVALAEITAVGTGAGAGKEWVSPHEPQIGNCGAAAGAISLALAIYRRESGTLSVSESCGATAMVQWIVL